MIKRDHDVQLAHHAGTLQFVKFETSRMDEVLSFIESHGLLKHDSNSGGGSLTEDGPVTSSADGDDSGQHNSDSAARVLATGGGAFKYATRFQVHT
jgi:pantothenate kinase